MKKNILKIKLIANLGLFVMLFSFYILGQYFDKRSMFIGVVIGSICLIHVLLQGYKPRFITMIMSIILMISHVMVSVFLNKNLLFFLIFPVILIYSDLTEQKIISSNNFKVLLYVYATLILFYYIVVGGDMNTWGNSSKNAISSIALTFSILFYLQEYHLLGRINNVIPSLLCFLMSALSMGRSGTVSSIILFFVVICNKKIISIRIVLYLFLILVTISFIFDKVYFIDKLNGIYRISQIGENVRYQIISDFFSSYGFKNLLVGFELNSIPLVKEYGGNPHNSYIQFLAYMGWGAVIWYLEIGLILLIYFVNRIYIFPMLLIPELLRISSDSYGFYGMDLIVSAVFILIGYKNLYRVRKKYNPKNSFNYN